VWFKRLSGLFAARGQQKSGEMSQQEAIEKLNLKNTGEQREEWADPGHQADKRVKIRTGC